MSKESLDSDRVNYLIWRYLVESNYPETAVRLQKEWNLHDPQQLPFAPHVTNHALVSVLNKGLLYHASERESARTTRDVVGPVRGFFGPVTAVPRPAAVDEDDVENVRKRQLGDDETPIQNGPSGKRPRLSNGYENGFDAMSKSPISLAIEVAMDVDEEQQQHGNGNAYPSPEQVPSPVIATNGPTIGTQIDKVAQLETETTFLDLSDDSRMTVLLHCEFNPRDPTILAATGTDALARMWTLSRTAPDLNSADKMQIDSPVFPPYLNLLDEGAPATTSVTGLSWSSDGNIIAVASEPLEEGNVKINLWNLEGVSVASFLEIESPVIILRWNLSNTLLLALSPKSAIGGAVITVMSPASQETIQYPLPSHSLFDQPLDAAWTGDEEFVLCGGDVLQAFQYAESEISPLRKYETREGHALSKVIYDWRSRLLVTAGDTGMIDIWDQQGQCRSFSAHQGLITSLVWQPLPSTTVLSDGAERLIASAGEDGCISIWNTRSPDSKSKFSMTMNSAVLTLSFTPDGAFIAGATTERILIWKVDDAGAPRASWTRGSELGWQTPQSRDSTPDEDHHSLCWDANGQKIAYGVNSLLAVINFRR